jgi:general secretion pathway protein L
VKSVDEADRLLNERLIRENRGNIAFSVPASALFSAVQQTQGVSIERISYRKDGTVLAGLTAVRNEDMNPALIALQNAGFVITATPRTDATGSSKADITVRAP